MGLQEKLESISKISQEIEAKRTQLIQKGLSSSDPMEILKAQQQLTSINQREKVDKKSYLLNPLDFQSAFGYKNRPTRMSYSMLRNMSKAPIVNAIIKTRINQVANFSEPQRNKYMMGFKISKKKLVDGQKLSEQETNEIEFLTDFINNCGSNASFEDDDFDTFLRKITKDSLTYDQMTFEVVRNKKGDPHKFLAVDASTIRVADSFDDDAYDKKGDLFGSQYDGKAEEILGYYPNYVQMWQGNIETKYYPWELCFGIRNPSSEVDMNGYGTSELEEMVKLVTSMLHSDEYNNNFFKQGSAPKGMLKVNGNFGDGRLQEFRQQWNATMRGVYNSWKTPIVEGDKVEWIDMQKSNRDMEYSNWVEYLIKITCAIYSIDPAEVNFPLSGSAGQTSMFEGSNEQRLKHSKDKGLYPLLKFIQKRLNKFLISHFFDGKYEFLFVGMDAITVEQELDQDIKMVSNFMTLNEVRAKRDLPPIENGDIVLNTVFIQMIQQASQEGMFGDEGEEGYKEDEEDEEENNEEENDDKGEAAEDKTANPFEKSLNDYFEKLNKK